MTTSREAFLQRVRQAVAEGNRTAGAPALKPRGDVGYQGAGPDPVERFRAELAAAGGLPHLVPDRAAAAEKVIELIRARGGRRILVGRGALLDSLDLPTRLRPLGIEAAVVDALPAEGCKEALFAADIGVSGAYALLADTGSVVVAAAPPEPRSLSLLPPVHIVVAGREQLLADLFDLFAALAPAAAADGEPPRLPSCLAVITGPSKTGDIELRLVTGVHGPGEVHVVLVTG
jgi:L-lactate utilization protein LutC